MGLTLSLNLSTRTRIRANQHYNSKKAVIIQEFVTSLLHLLDQSTYVAPPVAALPSFHVPALSVEKGSALRPK